MSRIRAPRITVPLNRLLKKSGRLLSCSPASRGRFLWDTEGGSQEPSPVGHGEGLVYGGRCVLLPAGATWGRFRSHTCGATAKPSPSHTSSVTEDFPAGLRDGFFVTLERKRKWD